MVGSNRRTNVDVTFACGHRHTIFQAAVHPQLQPPMDQVITERLHRDGILCHTCQYFAVVQEVQEDTYVEVLLGMGEGQESAPEQQPRPIPDNFDLLQMYFDMAQTFAQRVNQDHSTDVMDQCMNEFCRIVIARLSPAQRATAMAGLLDIQESRSQQSRGHVEIVRRLTEVLSNLSSDPMDVDHGTMGNSGRSNPNVVSPTQDTTMVDPGSSTQSNPQSQPKSQSQSGSQPPLPTTEAQAQAQGRAPDWGDVPSPTSSSAPGSSSPIEQALNRRQIGFTKGITRGSSPSEPVTVLPGNRAPRTDPGSDGEPTSVFGNSPPQQQRDPAGSTTHVNPTTPQRGGASGGSQSTTPQGPPPGAHGYQPSTTPQGPPPGAHGYQPSTTPEGPPPGNAQSTTPQGKPPPGSPGSRLPTIPEGQ
ncbi:hypothetical protein PG999_008026 [Apiospora kogelbergensis]|uniref:Uncharacterized protein n=1 Tax=Apiospora kogelbergensis TaxID=1337665 RepID=A0AAW0QPJ0_9PEZI